HHQRRIHGSQERVTVRRRLRDLNRSERRVGARTIFDHHRLAERLAHLLGDDPRQDVGGAAGRKRHDDPDRTVREVLLRRRGRERKGAEQAKSDTAESRHRTSAGAPVHGTVNPASLASGAQNAYSSVTNCATAAGSRSLVESASRSKCACIFGVLLIRLTSALSLTTMSAGRFFGPASPNQGSPAGSG